MKVLQKVVSVFTCLTLASTLPLASHAITLEVNWTGVVERVSSFGSDKVDPGDEVAGSLLFATLGDTAPATHIGAYPARPAGNTDKIWGFWSLANLSRGETLVTLPNVPANVRHISTNGLQICDDEYINCSATIRNETSDLMNFFTGGDDPYLTLSVFDPTGNLASGDEIPTGRIALNGTDASFMLVSSPVNFTGSITSMEITAIPLPSTMLMFASVLAPALLWLKRRKRLSRYG